jgi:hypothetical protein
MVGEVIAGLGAFKTMYDMAKALKDINDATIRNGAVIELQEKILAAREAQTALLERVGELEKEVARLKDWEADKSRYQLAELRRGMVALLIKETMRNGEPVHYICADCASNGKKFYLQQYIAGPYYDEFQCNGCGAKLGVDKGTPPTHPDDYEDEFISVR